MSTAKHLRPVPRHSALIRLLGRPTSRNWLLRLADHEDPRDRDTLNATHSEVIRRLNRALAAPGDPRANN